MDTKGTLAQKMSWNKSFCFVDFNGLLHDLDNDAHKHILFALVTSSLC